MVEDQNSVEEEVTPQDQEPNTIEPEHESEEAQAQELPKEEKDWRGLRKKAEAAEYRNRELEDRLKQQEEMMKALLQSQAPQAPQKVEVDEFADIDPEDYPTWKMTDKRIERRAEEIAERKYRELEAKREQSRFLERLKQKYPDFEQVVNPDAIASFEKQEPELAQTIAELKDPYKMGLQTYNFLKRAHDSSSSSEKKNAKEVEKNLEKGKKAVQSPQAYEKRPMAKAFDIASMGEEEKNAIYQEMMGHAMRSPGF